MTNLINGKYYVGKTCHSLARRFREHVNVAYYPCQRDYRRYLQFAIRKYGYGAFTIEPLAILNNEKAGNNFERLWILVLNSTDNTVGYNMSAGGDGFYDPSGAIAKKISASLKGRKMSAEFCRKQSQRMTGSKMPPRTEEHKRNHALASLALRKPRMHGPELSPEMKMKQWRTRQQDSARRRWAEGKNCSGSLAALVKGRIPEHTANARKALEALPKEERREMLRQAANARWHPGEMVAPMLHCSIAGCTRPYSANGLCHTHYTVVWRSKRVQNAVTAD